MLKNNIVTNNMINIFTEILWDFLQNLGIITDDNFQHEYFGDIKQLVTVVRYWLLIVNYSLITVLNDIYFYLTGVCKSKISCEKNDR